jgi:hypothetical protein
LIFEARISLALEPFMLLKVFRECDNVLVRVHFILIINNQKKWLFFHRYGGLTKDKKSNSLKFN